MNWKAGRVALVLAMTASQAVAAQAVSERTPNVPGGWIAARGVVQLNFLHRFSISDAPIRKVTNTPTFNLGTGLTDRLMAGVVYGSNSVLVPAYPNEWELYGRAMPLEQGRGHGLDVSVQAGYNLASESVDGELLLARRLGPLTVIAAGRAFSRALDTTDVRYAVAAGMALRLTPSVALAGDIAALTNRRSGERAAWSAGLQLGVPFTPHSFSVHVSNVGTASLEGTSIGDRTRWGFEYTVPITVRRLLPRSASAGDPMEMSVPASADTVFINIRELRFQQENITVAPRTTVVWVNQDPIQHSVTADSAGFDSGLIDPGSRYSRTYADEGTFPYHCTPHPFMKGSVTVRSMDAAIPEEAGQ